MSAGNSGVVRVCSTSPAWSRMATTPCVATRLRPSSARITAIWSDVTAVAAPGIPSWVEITRPTTLEPASRPSAARAASGRAGKSRPVSAGTQAPLAAAGDR